MEEAKLPEIIARYTSTCPECGQQISVGDRIRVESGRRAWHVHCPGPRLSDCPIKVQFSSGYDGEAPAVGETFREASADGQGRILTALVVVGTYYAQDGLSFGVGDDSGWIWTVGCRLATPEEAQPILEAEAAAERHRQARRRLDEVKRRFRRDGERPRPPQGLYEPRGERVLDTQDIHGGGDWFVVGRDAIWYVVNNGADGDDWSLNNVRTGGAGAIGWRLPFDQALADELDAIEAVLQPEAHERRAVAASGPGRDCYERCFAAHVDEGVWGPPSAPPVTPPHACWVRLGDSVYVGLDVRGDTWLAACTPDAYSRYGVYGFLGDRHAVALRYEPTPARIGEVVSRLPAWTSLAQVQRVLHAWIDESGLGVPERVATEPTGELGRFRLPGSNGWAATARDAIFGSAVARCALDQVEHEPGVSLLHVSGKGGGQSSKAWALWSDDGVTRGAVWGPRPKLFTQAADELIALAIGRKQLDWRKLRDVVSCGRREVQCSENGGLSSGEEYRLEELTLTHADGHRSTAYCVTVSWWAMGEDGDAGEDAVLYDTLEEATAAYDRARRGAVDPR